MVFDLLILPTHAILDILTASLDNIILNQCTTLLLNLRKAFDTANHDIFLKKIYHYGIRRNAHKLFASFLTDRQQSVSLNSVQSHKKS